jgi:chromosome partitioning protein
MGKIITITNQKGGVGKTTSAINISASLSQAGKKVLLIDIDPQSNATTGLGIMISKNQPTVYEVLLGITDVKDAIIRIEDFSGMWILPSHIRLVGAQVELLERENREFILQKILAKLRNHLDYIFIDCPPSLGILTINALVAADTVLIPIQCEYYALEGLGQLLVTLRRVQRSYNPNLRIEGVLLTMFDPRLNLSNQVVEQAQSYFGDRVFKTIVHRNIRLAEAPSYGKPALLYDKSSRGAKNYLSVAQEIING